MTQRCLQREIHRRAAYVAELAQDATAPLDIVDSESQGLLQGGEYLASAGMEDPRTDFSV